MAAVRLDQLLLQRGLVTSARQALGLIMAGKVLVDDRPSTKPGTLIAPHAEIRLLEKPQPWVSRGGLKLAHALNFFSIHPKNNVCLDVGASTGGFTDALLQGGARKVYAVDVGYGLLAWKLVQDPRVVVLDRTNIRQMEATMVPEAVDMLTMDVSFIALSQALPPALVFLRHGGCGVVLLKPQFELPRDKVTKGGVIQDPELHQEAITSFEQLAERLDLRVEGVTPSPVTGSKGNREFLFCFRKNRD